MEHELEQWYNQEVGWAVEDAEVDIVDVETALDEKDIEDLEDSACVDVDVKDMDSQVVVGIVNNAVAACMDVVVACMAVDTAVVDYTFEDAVVDVV